MAKYGTSGGSGSVWDRVQEGLTNAAATVGYGLRRLTVWMKGLDRKQRTTVLSLTLAAVLLVISGIPRMAEPGGTSGSSARTDRESTSRRTCLTCLGSGKCDDCNGTGYDYVRGSGGTPIKTGCNTCHGSGDCSNSQCKNGMVPFR